MSKELDQIPLSDSLLQNIEVGRLSPADIDELTDKNGDGIADVLDYKVKGYKPWTYQIVKSKKRSNVWKAIRATFAGETTVGMIGREIKNVAKYFVPFGHKIDAITDGVGDSFKSKKRNKPMLKKVFKIKNIINFKDDNGNFSLEELGASLLQIVIAGAVVWGAVKLGIWDQLMQLIG